MFRPIPSAYFLASLPTVMWTSVHDPVSILFTFHSCLLYLCLFSLFEINVLCFGSRPFPSGGVVRPSVNWIIACMRSGVTMAQLYETPPKCILLKQVPGSALRIWMYPVVMLVRLIAPCVNSCICIHTRILLRSLGRIGCQTVYQCLLFTFTTVLLRVLAKLQVTFTRIVFVDIH